MEKQTKYYFSLTLIVILLLAIIYFFMKRYQNKKTASQDSSFRMIKGYVPESSFGMRSGYVYGNHVYPYPPVAPGIYGPTMDLQVTRCGPGSRYDWFEGYCRPVGDSLI